MDVAEELELGTRLGEVAAIDEDIEENAVINYAIICEYMPRSLHSVTTDPICIMYTFEYNKIEYLAVAVYHILF